MTDTPADPNRLSPTQPPKHRRRTTAGRATLPHLAPFPLFGAAPRQPPPPDLDGYVRPPPKLPGFAMVDPRPPQVPRSLLPPNPYTANARPWLPLQQQTIAGSWSDTAGETDHLLPQAIPTREEFLLHPQEEYQLGFHEQEPHQDEGYPQGGYPRHQGSFFNDRPSAKFGDKFGANFIKDAFGEQPEFDTPLQWHIVKDLINKETTKFDVPTMLKYANLQRDMDMQKAERERDVARENLENEVAGTMDRRDPKAPNGCLWGMCNMPRGVHGHQCLGEGREGLACTDADHKVGICDEREENRRQKMKAVGLDPDAVEGPSGGWEVPKNAIGRSVEDEADQWDYSA